MLYNKNNLAIHPIASKSETRPEITGVLFKKNLTVATDSFCLIEVKNPEQGLGNIKDLPLLSDKSKPFIDMPKRGVIIPAKSVKKAGKNLAEIPEQNLPILNNMWLLMPKENQTSAMASTDLETENITKCKNIDGAFPDYQNAIPNDKGYSKLTVDLKKLKQVVDVLSSMDNNDLNTIEVYLNPDDKPLMIKMKTKQNQEVNSLIMPIKATGSSK